MNLQKLWILDPLHKNRPSVSLTLLLFSIVMVTIFGTLECFEKVKSIGPFSELMYSCFALYFGRRFQVKGEKFSAEKAEKVEKKLEEES